MDNSASDKFDSCLNENNPARILAKPQHMVTSQSLNASAALPPPQNNPEISQIWKADALRASQRLEHSLNLLARLNLDDSTSLRQLTPQYALSWPPAGSRVKDEWRWLDDFEPKIASTTSPSGSHPLSSPSMPGAAETPLLSATRHNHQEWASFSGWALSPAQYDAHAPVGGLTQTAFRSSPSPDSVFGSDTDSSEASTYGFPASLSPVPLSQMEGSFGKQNFMAKEQVELYRDARDAVMNSRFDPTQISPVPVSLPPAHVRVDNGRAPLLLARASSESKLTNELQIQQGFRYDQHRNPVQNFIPVGYFVVHERPDDPSQVCSPRRFEARSPEGPSPNNRKRELYKTEICRNWEEKSSCEYGRYVGFSLTLSAQIPASADLG